MSHEMIGWLASMALVVTLTHQVFNQWSSGTSAGVSPWLFVGQLAASAGFTAYSVLIENTVFIVTNSLIAASAVIGLAVLLRHRRRARRAGAGAECRPDGVTPATRSPATRSSQASPRCP